MPSTVKKHFIAAKDTGNDLIAQCRDNQIVPREACEAIRAARRPDGRDRTVDGKRRNRHEHRSCEVFHLTGCGRRMPGPDWMNLITRAIRGHWRIENRLHHVRDVTLGEDASRIRRNPTRFARSRAFALNILRANGAHNIKRELYRNTLNIQRILDCALELFQND